MYIYGVPLDKALGFMFAGGFLVYGIGVYNGRFK
jgi:hypothetical protein